MRAVADFVDAARERPVPPDAAERPGGSGTAPTRDRL